MSELTLTNFTGNKKNFVNSVPKNTPVFIYGKYDVETKKYNITETDAANEFFIKRELGLDEEEQIFEDTQQNLNGIGKKNDNSITSLRIKEIIEVNKNIIEFILNNLHRL